MKLSRNMSIIVLLFAILFSVSCSSRDSESILVFAAASLGDALKSIKTSYEMEHGAEIIFSLGAKF